METTEIEIAENNGQLVQLDAGKTIVNLVLKKVSIEGLSTTNTSFVTNMQRVVSIRRMNILTMKPTPLKYDYLPPYICQGMVEKWR